MATATDPATPAGLAAAFDALGDTATSVAATLAQAGYAGHIGCELSCPIVWYLRVAFPCAIDTYASVVKPNGDDRHRTGIGLLEPGWSDIRMPPGRAAFITAFEHGDHGSIPGWITGALS